MPSAITHYEFGQTIFRQLPDELHHIVRHHLPLYTIGLYGFTMFYFPFPRFRRMDRTIKSSIPDTDWYTFFQHALSVLRDSGDPEAGLAYLFGCICHFSLEREWYDTVIPDHKSRSKRFQHKFYLPESPAPRNGDTDIIASFFPFLTGKQIRKFFACQSVFHALPWLSKHARSDRFTDITEETRQRQAAVPLALHLCENYYNAYSEIDILSEQFHGILETS